MIDTWTGSNLGSVFNDNKSSFVIANPPNIILEFNFYASSIAYLTSNPGMNGWKSSLNAN